MGFPTFLLPIQVLGSDVFVWVQPGKNIYLCISMSVSSGQLCNAGGINNQSERFVYRWSFGVRGRFFSFYKGGIACRKFL